jgi:hypothetical protein
MINKIPTVIIGKNAIPQLWGSRAILNFLFCEKTYSLAYHFEFRKKDLPTGVILRGKINNPETLVK